MGGAIPPLPQYAFMAWCSSKKSKRTTLPLPFYYVMMMMMMMMMMTTTTIINNNNNNNNKKKKKKKKKKYYIRQTFLFKIRDMYELVPNRRLIMQWAHMSSSCLHVNYTLTL
jgi:hypothetical protein